MNKQERFCLNNIKSQVDSTYIKFEENLFSHKLIIYVNRNKLTDQLYTKIYTQLYVGCLEPTNLTVRRFVEDRVTKEFV